MNILSYRLNQKTLSLWLLSLLLVLPFNISTRFPPYKSFYQDIIVILLIFILFLSVLNNKQLSRHLPKGSLYFFVLAVYWCIQPLLVDLSYAEENIRISLLFLLLGLLVWSVSSLVLHHGQDSVIAWVAWGLFIGACIQCLVLLMQLTGVAQLFRWLVFSDGTGVSGQLGQRNMLGHYIMWGVLAAAYLTGKQRITFAVGIFGVFFLGGCLGLVGSRTIVAYVLAVLLLLMVARFFFEKKPEKVMTCLFVAVCWVLLAQWFLSPFLGALGIDIESGLGRLIDSPNAQLRTPEWGKAWHSFLSAPMFGHGWHGYTYQSILFDWTLIPDTAFRSNGYFYHCHNIVLQVLAEMGGVGAVLVFGGLLWTAVPMLKRLNQSDYLWVVALLSVTACHSLLEFPLWYTYFLAAAVVFFAIGLPVESSVPYAKVEGAKRAILLVLGGFGLASVIFVLGFNQWLIQKHLRALPDVWIYDIRAKATVDLTRSLPLLPRYDDLDKIKHIDIVEGELSPEDFALIEKYNRHLPILRVALLQGLSLYRQGKKEASLEWMKKVWHYYPRGITFAMREMYRVSPVFKDLEQPAYQQCLRLLELNLYPESIKECEKPPE